MSEKIVSFLKSILRKSAHEKQGHYTMVTGEVEEGARVVVCIAPGYSKIILEEDLHSLDCTEAEYTPHGLYAFSDNPEELASKVVEKINMLLRRRRLAER